MTRCIHCTRCIRFTSEIAGVHVLGATSRGEHMEVGTYLEQGIASELSGNLVDICPVGALTSKPTAYTFRPWELRKTESVDVFDAVGSNIRVDSRFGEVMRILPRLNEDVNEEWISDKTRFAFDGLKRKRLDRPYLRENGKLRAATWAEAFTAIAAKLRGLPGERMAAIAGDLVDAESMMALKDLMAGLGSQNIDCRQDGAKIDPRSRAGYLFNTGIAGIEQADAILLVGTNPRREAALINARIRKRHLYGGLKVASIGAPVDLTYPVTQLGEGPQALQALLDGQGDFAEILRNAKNPMVILGVGALARADGAAVLAAVRSLATAFNMVRDDWNGFNLLHTAAARVGGLDLGFVPGPGGRDIDGILAGAQAGEVEFVWLLGADEFDMDRLGNAFVVYQGHTGDRGAHRADVILPGAAYTEKAGTYVNTEGRVQRGRMAAHPPGDAREDWKIVRALSDLIGKKLPYDSLDQLRGRLVEANPVFGAVDRVTPAAWGEFGTAGQLGAEPFAVTVENFYMTDAISRASATMAECTAEFVAPQQGKTGTHG